MHQSSAGIPDHSKASLHRTHINAVHMHTGIVHLVQKTPQDRSWKKYISQGETL